ncbi:hypothetical protein A0H81_11788 [Grifola frondosa]|uniref:Protein kinase domain-containing protein n=1 Tax=Grifola frondosa TaxID=5627 RepID=A0A1C7LZ85_GRIFR|nr:hypothetical protein A0H81_11788 [Grifola frondosa]
MLPLALILCTVLFSMTPVFSQFADPTAVASQFSLTTSTSIPFPTATLSNADAQSFIVSGWSLSKGRIQNGAENIAFVDDPFPNAPAPSSTSNTSGPVLQVQYPAGGFGSNTSGLQLYSLWNTSDGSAFQSMMLTYEVAFDANFTFVKGGKLPGVRGGPDPDGCSGGVAANGSNCFSTRLMWRKEAAGEVYAYMLTPNNICSNSDFICNSDGFGTSIDRGSFSFVNAQWNRVTVVVRMNTASTVNGMVSLYYNNVKALEQDALYYRSSSGVNINGLYLSTFFGGSDSSWAPNSTVHSYFRNFELWGSSSHRTSLARKSALPPFRCRRHRRRNPITELVNNFNCILRLDIDGLLLWIISEIWDLLLCHLGAEIWIKPPVLSGPKVVSFENKTIWTLYDATKRDDGTPVSVFEFDANTPAKKNLFPLAKNALRKLRTVRHPEVLKFMDAVESDSTIYIMTERVRPLGSAVQDWSSKGVQERRGLAFGVCTEFRFALAGLYVAGLRVTDVQVALSFLNDSAGSTHGNVRVDSVFISSSGEWKLGDLMC